MNANLQALAGGLLIGAAAAVLLLSSGRIAGISGIVGRLVVGDAGPRGWRIAFVAGLLLSTRSSRAATRNEGKRANLFGTPNPADRCEGRAYSTRA